MVENDLRVNNRPGGRMDGWVSIVMKRVEMSVSKHTTASV